jgi:hypothetical protein
LSQAGMFLTSLVHSEKKPLPIICEKCIGPDLLWWISAIITSTRLRQAEKRTSTKLRQLKGPAHEIILETVLFYPTSGAFIRLNFIFKWALFFWTQYNIVTKPWC